MGDWLISLEFTNHCNFKCIYCPQAVYKQDTGRNVFNREKGHISDGVFNVARYNIDRYAKIVSIGFFGEQMLHPKFEEYIDKLAFRKRYKLSFNSNCSLITDLNFDTIKKFDLFRVSLDASNGTLWNELCPGDTVKDLDGSESPNKEDRFKVLEKKIESWLSRADHPPIELECVVLSHNKHDTKNLIKKWRHKLGPLDRLVIKTVLTYGGVMKDSFMKAKPCGNFRYKRFTIAWNGDCTPCNFDVNIAMKVGNILKDRDILDMMNKPEGLKIMDQIKKREVFCTHCFDAENNRFQVLKNDKF